MSNYYSLTMEAKIRKEKRTSIYFYNLFLASIVLSALLTILMNEI